MSDKKIDLDGRLQILCKLYEHKIPFNKLLGLKVESLNIEDVRLKFEMKEAFIGNYVHGILHGGVISAVLDTTGGITASLGVLQKMAGRTAEEIGKSLTKIGTIDLRIGHLLLILFIHSFVFTLSPDLLDVTQEAGLNFLEMLQEFVKRDVVGIV